MLEHALAGVTRTPVDRCPTCGGVWLDGDERRKLARATTREGQGTKTERLVKRGAIWVAQLLTQVPVEVENPARGTPYFVLALIVALVLLFVGQQLGYVDTYAYAVVPGRLRAQGDWETLLSYMVLHGSWVHLAGNAYFLYTFGDNIEHLFGRLRFPTFLIACAVVGALAHSLFAIFVSRKTATPLVGISGSISGVLAAYLWAFPRQRLFQVILWIQIKIPVWVYLFVWIGFHLLMGFFGVGESAESVAWFAHLGGFLTGLALTPWYLAIRRREVSARVRVPATL